MDNLGAKCGVLGSACSAQSTVACMDLEYTNGQAYEMVIALYYLEGSY